MINFLKKFSILLVFIFLISSFTLAKPYDGPVPKSFDQAPDLEEKVEEGILPSIEERLPIPEDIYVVEPEESIGNYGGTLRTTSIRPEGYGDDSVLASFRNMIKPNPEGNDFIPEVAKKVEASSDMTTYTMHLRQGMKWSDGEPLTADDIMFWYNDILLNKQLTSAVWPEWKADGEVVEVTKLDKYTVQFKYAAPKPFFKNSMVHSSPGIFTPKHYLKQFHPNYNSKEKIVEEAKEKGYDNWVAYFEDRNDVEFSLPMNKERPTIAAYILEEKTSSKRIYKRNPYYWKVDPEGNQLPYLDRIRTQIVTDVEVVQGMIMSNEIDFAGMQTDIRNYPMYKKYEDKGNYRTMLWESGMGSDVIYMVNLTHKDPQLREIFQNTKFRRALSIGINRKEISESIYFGRAEPRQYTVLETSKYYEPEYAKAYTEFKPEEAKAMLDEIGLKDVNGDGWREYPNGDKFVFTIEYFSIETPKQPNVELVASHWRDLGLNIKTKSITGELADQRAPANMMDSTIWHGDKATDIYFPRQPQFMVPVNPGWERTIWPAWGRWLSTDGESGEEPPANIKNIYDWFQQVTTEPNPEKRNELAQKILEAQAENLWCIGTVGKAPAPITINKNLRNFPKDGFWVWDLTWSMSRDPSQIYFENE